MINVHHKLFVTVLLAAIATGVAPAQTRPGPAVTPEASRALKKTGEALRGLRDYEIEMKGSTRTALGDGRYRDFAGTIHYTISRPDRLAAHVLGEGLERWVFYDGQAIVVYAPRQKKYARIPAPGDISTFLAQMQAHKGIELPIASLFAWGTAADPMRGMSSGAYAGRGSIDGRACEHYTYDKATVSWHIWVDEAHLPCKLVMVDTQDPGLPGYQADITIKPGQVSDEAFRFVPEAGIEQVDLPEIGEADPTGADPV